MFVYPFDCHACWTRISISDFLDQDHVLQKAVHSNASGRVNMIFVFQGAIEIGFIQPFNSYSTEKLSYSSVLNMLFICIWQITLEETTPESPTPTSYPSLHRPISSLPRNPSLLVVVRVQ